MNKEESLSDKIRKGYTEQGLKARNIILSKDIKEKVKELMEFESICIKCGMLIKTEPYCWENHMEEYHKEIGRSEEHTSELQSH